MLLLVTDCDRVFDVDGDRDCVIVVLFVVVLDGVCEGVIVILRDCDGDDDEDKELDADGLGAHTSLFPYTNSP